MAEYSRQQIISLYEDYSHLDESQLLEIIQQELRLSIDHIKLIKDKRKNTLLDLDKENNNLKRHLIDDIKKLAEHLNNDSIDTIQIKVIRDTCNRILEISCKYQNTESLLKAKEVSELLDRLKILYNSSDSIQELQHICFSLFIELQSKINNLIKNPITKNAALDSLTAIVNLLIDYYFVGIGVAIPVAITTAIINNILKSKNKKRTDPYPSHRRRPRLDFYEMGLSRGDVLNWKDNTTITITVSSKRTILFNGKETSISEVTRDLKKSKWNVPPCPNWLYKGKLLSDIYDETYPIII